MKQHNCFCLLLMLTIVAQVAIANPKDSVGTTKVNKYVFEADYGSNSEFNGRTNGTHPYISPSFFYKGRKGFRSGILGYYTPGTSQPFDALAISEGWKFNLNEDWDAILEYNHTWSTDVSSRLSSVLNNSLTLNTDYDFDIVDVYLSGNYYFTSENRRQRRRKSNTAKSLKVEDYSVEGSISHSFDFDNIFKSKSDFSIIPEASIVFGTQNFVPVYSTEVKKDSAIASAIESNAKKFCMLDYKFGLYLDYYVGKFLIEPNIAYYIPTNLLQGQEIDPYFVFTLSLEFTLKSKSKKKIK